MKYLLALFLGVVSGAFVAVGLLYFNPLTSESRISPLSVSDSQQLSLGFSAVAGDAIVYTNDGESRIPPYPERVLQLWEASIRDTDAMVTMLRNGRNETAGIGVKFSSPSESTRLLNGEVLEHSVWYVYLPGQGTMLIEQTENHWNFLREIVVPAHWSSGDSWRGNWNGTITSGPGALGTGWVHGGSGVFRDLESEAIEMLKATAYSAETGPVAVDGQIIVDLPARNAALSEP